MVRLLSVCAALVLLGCEPFPASLDEAVPCVRLRVKVCGAHDECAAAIPGDACSECKARVCQIAAEFESHGDDALCAGELRARPEYPSCKPLVPNVPYYQPQMCEGECYPLRVPSVRR